MADHVRSGRAVVIGGSLAGLLAARVLADRFDEVVLVERDTYPDEPEPRKGVPQSRHLHILLVRGQRLLEALFPGLMAELREAGAASLNWPRDILWLGAAGWGSRTARGMTLVSSRRELLEYASGVAWSPGRTCSCSRRPRPTASSASKRAGGYAASACAPATAAMVRTASSMQTSWSMPPALFMGRVMAHAARPWRPRGDRHQLVPGLRQPVLRATARRWVARLEGPALPAQRPGRVAGRWRVPGRRWPVARQPRRAARDYPPVDEPGFLAFAASLRSPALHEALVAARPVSPIWLYRRTQNRVRHFERLRRGPRGSSSWAMRPAASTRSMDRG